ncbi:hypothetical protein ACFE04_005037 [Oxalis oulophora]
MSSPIDPNVSDSADIGVSEPQYDPETLLGIIFQDASTAMVESLLLNQQQPTQINWGPLTAIFHGFAGSQSEHLTRQPMPALKASVESMPKVVVTEKGKECAICLEEFAIGGEAKEISCKHLFHSSCLEKWLEIHGSCPVCRFEVPAAYYAERCCQCGR